MTRSLQLVAKRCGPVLLFSLLAVLPSCDKSPLPLDPLVDQPKKRPLRPSNFFGDGNSARPLVAGTVTTTGFEVKEELAGGMTPRGPTRDALAYVDAAKEFPFPVTARDLRRGQSQFNIFCSPCHGQTGDGNGMIVRRGFTRPPSFYDQRLRDAPPGLFYNVITHGYGAMYSYNERVAPDDRWRIAAYVKALQLSRDAKPGDLSPEDRQKLSSVRE